MAKRPAPSTVVNPLPVAWDAGRDARGCRPGGRLARCTTRGCPWRWSSGDDRACPWCRYEADWDALEARAQAAGIELAVR